MIIQRISKRRTHNLICCILMQKQILSYTWYLASTNIPILLNQIKSNQFIYRKYTDVQNRRINNIHKQYTNINVLSDTEVMTLYNYGWWNRKRLAYRAVHHRKKYTYIQTKKIMIIVELKKRKEPWNQYLSDDTTGCPSLNWKINPFRVSQRCFQVL